MIAWLLNVLVVFRKKIKYSTFNLLVFHFQIIILLLLSMKVFHFAASVVGANYLLEPAVHYHISGDSYTTFLLKIINRVEFHITASFSIFMEAISIINITLYL